MDEIIIIACSTSKETLSLSRQITEIPEEFIALAADSTEELRHLLKEYGCNILLIDRIRYRDDAAELLLQKDTALLLLSEPSREEECAVQLSELPGICDMLITTSPSAILRQKISSLLRQQKLTREFIRLRDKHSQLSKELETARQSLTSQQHYLNILTERDGLTGLYNRNHLTTVLKKEFQHARRYNTELVLLLLNIDHFKAINRKYGHLYGDSVLNEIAARLTSNTRESDLCFRFGGGKFLVLLPHTNLGSGCKAAEKLKACCVAKKINNGQCSNQITISAGIASLVESSPESPDQFIDMADMALCQAEAGGRNRLKAYSREESLRTTIV